MTAKTIAFPTEQRPSTERQLLNMILDNAHIHDCAFPGKSVMTVVLSSKQVDRLSCYEAGEEDLEHSHDAEQDDAA